MFKTTFVLMICFLGHSAYGQGFQPIDTDDVDEGRNYDVPTKVSKNPRERIEVPFCNNKDRNALLMIIDMQDFFVLRGGKGLKRENAARTKAVIDHQIKAIENAKKANLPIVFVEYDEQGPTSAAFHAVIKDYKKVSYIKKNTDGVFSSDNKYRRDLEKILREERVKTIIMAGANAEYCVQESIQGALQGNCDVIAFENGIADFNYKQFITSYHYGEERGLKIKGHRNTGMCVDCRYQQLKTADDLVPYMRWRNLYEPLPSDTPESPAAK